MWSLTAAIAVYLTISTSAHDDDALVFTFNNISVHYNSENLEKFHNCLCDDNSISCTVHAPVSATLQTIKHRSLGAPGDAYINAYECLFGLQDALSMVCTRAKSPASCEHDLCHPACFTNRSTCDLYNVSTVFTFNEMAIVQMDAPSTLLDGLCEADEVCAPNKSCGTPASTSRQSGADRDLTGSVESESIHVAAPLEAEALESEEMDCSNVCPALARMLLVNKAVVATAVFLYVCSVRVF